MKWRSSYLTELQKSLRPGAKAELVTARKMFGGKKSIGLGTIASYRMDPKQRMQRIHYTMACAKWGTLSSGDKAAYATWAEDKAVTVFSSFLHSYLSQLKEDLVLYTPMEKITGATVKDYSKYGNDGTNTDAIVEKPGYIDNSLKFNGASAFVNHGNPASMNITGPLTVAAWVNVVDPTQADTQHVVCRFNSYVVQVVANTGFPYFYVHDSLGWQGAHNAKALDAGKWYHIVGMWISSAAGKQHIYINGSLGTNTATQDAPQDSGNVFESGRNTSVGEYLDGQIDELRVYKKAFTAEEITAMYRQEAKWHGDTA